MRALSIAAAGLIAGFVSASPPADLIITNARIYTVDPGNPWAAAVAIRGARLIGVGGARAIDRLRGPRTRVLDAEGRLMLPAIEDSHVHFVAGALRMKLLDLSGATTLTEVRQRIRDWAAAHPRDPWIRGSGWIYTTFPGGLPTREELDRLVPDRPALMSCADGHSFWVNSRALAAARIDRRTPDPPTGSIRHDPDGEPNGILDEGAVILVTDLIPKPSRSELTAALLDALRAAAREGVVRMHSLGGDFEHLDIFDEIRRRHELTARLSVAMFVDPPAMTQSQWRELRAARRRYRDDWISVDGAKMMLDGVIDAYTGAMVEPYADRPDLRGKLLWDPAVYTGTVAALDRERFQVSTHAIGDAAIRLALDAYEAAASANGDRDRRDKVEHVEAIAASDIPRFARLGVIASFQPLHANPDPSWIGSWIPHVGPERERRAMAWKSLLRSGARLAFGSDWPVVPISPWRGIQIAVTRQDFQGNPPGGWIPSERITVPEAVHAYTMGGAYAMRRERDEGSVEAGKLADLIVLSQNIFEIDPHGIGDTKVLMTIVGGRVIYEEGR